MNPLKLGAAELDRMPAIPDAQMTAEQKKVMDEIAAGPRFTVPLPKKKACCPPHATPLRKAAAQTT